MAFVVRRCRERSTAALQERRDAWQQGGVSITRASQSAQRPDSNTIRPDYRDVHSQVVHDVLTRLDRAFHAFVRRVQAGEMPGYPRVQGANRYTSFTSFTYTQCGTGATLDNGVRVVSTIGRSAVRWSRPLAGTPKTVMIAKEADGWYGCMSCAEVPTQPWSPPGKETGSDVGLTVFRITGAGDVGATPRHHRTVEKHLKKAQRRVSRRTRGSKRRKTAVKLLAKHYPKVKRQRRDVQCKTALTRLRHDDTIRRHDLSRRPTGSERGAKVSPIKQHLGCWMGAVSHHTRRHSSVRWPSSRRCAPVPPAYTCLYLPIPAYTSQDCSACGERITTSLSVRTHVCTSCGLVLARDENAALHSKRLGQSLRGVVAVAAAVNRASPVL
jgi:putative transposase